MGADEKKDSSAPIATAAQIRFFEEKIRPLLHDHCWECHGPDKQKADLRLDSREALLKGSENGLVVQPGNARESLLFQAISHAGELKMPPKKARLPDEALAAVENWINQGLPWPAYDRAKVSPTTKSPGESGPKLRKRKFEITAEDRQWWSFQPIRKSSLPSVRGKKEARTEIDAFLLQKLEEQKLTFSPVASRRELIRRAYFDLLGLPPTPEEVAAFEKDPSPQAWERLIDDLLNRPHYGERWARHWLDLVRYAETNGYERDGVKPNAWRYRDYVIRSFNMDKPYDRFVLEQLAGDELPGFNPDALVATGFYRLHVWDDEPDSTLAAEFDDLDDIMVTTGATFLGLTIGCARCHDHKFDPIAQTDYYQLLSFMRNISPYGLHKTGGGGRGVGKISRPLASPQEIQRWEENKQIRLKEHRAKIASAEGEARKKLEEQLKQLDGEQYPDQALTIAEDGLKPTFLFKRGDVLSPGDEVFPILPQIFGAEKPAISAQPGLNSSGRRLALAEWVARKDNPLTARVLVNRLWQHHFGRGLVETVNDFGRTGLKPSHPELLDFLASDLIEGGWKLKRLHKQIMLSRAYQMSSHPVRHRGYQKDEANTWFWRQNPRRAESEVLRDSILAVSGTLNPKMGGPSFFPALPKEVHRTQDGEKKGWQDSSQDEQNRRTIYIHIKRALLPPLLETFDYTTTTMPVGARSVTTVAPQALMLLNDAFVHQQAVALANRLLKEAGSSQESMVQRAFALVVQRKPTPREMQLSLHMLKKAGPPEKENTPLALQNFCVAMLNLNEFLYVD